MQKMAAMGVWRCLLACTGICGSGCTACLVDGPIFIADTATGGTALASGAAAGASS